MFFWNGKIILIRKHFSLWAKHFTTYCTYLSKKGFLAYFCPKQGQDFKPSAALLYPNIGQVPPPPPGHGGEWGALAYEECQEWTTYCWFSHDVTKFQTSEILILLKFYFHAV